MMHNCSIRKLELDKLEIEQFFYDTFYFFDGVAPLPKEIVKLPYYQKFIEHLGSRVGDYYFAAKDIDSGKVVGFVWTRFIDDPMAFDDKTPFLLISVSASYRKKGIGYELMQHILDELSQKGYPKVSLTVNKCNPAIYLYEKCGFTIYSSDADNYSMIRYL